MKKKSWEAHVMRVKFDPETWKITGEMITLSAKEAAQRILMMKNSVKQAREDARNLWRVGEEVMNMNFPPKS